MATTLAAPILRVEVTTAYNFVVDSNVETPATYAPRAAYITARIWNDGDAPLTGVIARVGDGVTPGTYPTTTVLPGEGLGYDGVFSLVHEGGSMGTVDASRALGTIEPGQYKPVYWLVSYPNLDASGNSVTGGSKPEDDLVLDYTVWATADGPQSDAVARTATMRNCISALANKIFPNTANKVPQEYQDLLAKYAPEWSDLAADGSPGTSIVTQGIWYDLGNVGQGFDNDGNLVPDYNAWLQPVGDPSLIDTSAFRLVNTYALIVVKLKDGGELVYDVKDQLYFTNLPENTGVIGLVRYDYLPLLPNTSAQLTPYQMAASGFDNEKFNGDYGAGIGGSQSAPSPLLLDKSVNLAETATGETLVYTIPFSNPGTQVVGNPDLGLPLVIQDSIPADTTYVAGTASLAGGLSHVVYYSADNGLTWTNVEPPAATVTNLQWWLTEPFDPGESGTASFSVTVDSSALLTVDNTAGLSFGNTTPFLHASAQTRILGINSLSGLVFEDNGAGGGGVFGDGLQNGTETFLPNITLTLYYDADASGTLTGGDLLWETTSSAPANGTYSFTDLPDGNWLVVVDTQDADLPTGATRTTEVLLAADLDAGSLSASPVSVTDLDFGFAPALTLDKSGPTTAREGDLVTYTLAVTNEFVGDGSGTPSNLTYFGWAATATDGSKAWTTPANATGAPDSLYAEGVFKSPAKTIILSNFGFGDPPETISTVTVDLILQKSGAFDANDELTVTASPGPAAIVINMADLVNGTNTIDITGAIDWSLVNFNSGLTITLDTDVGGLTGTLLLDAVGVRVVTTTTTPVSSNLTLYPVPLFDTYEADKYEFVAATPSPTGTEIAGNVGTLTWADIGPIFPGGTETVEVTFRVLEPANNTATTHTNVADVQNARFQNGDPANDATDTVVTSVLPGGLIAGTLWRDFDAQGDQDGGTETGIQGVTVQLTPPAGVDLGAGVGLPITTVTDGEGYYEFDGLPASGVYTVTVLTATLPGGSGTNTYDKDNGIVAPNNVALQNIVYDSTTGADTVTDVDFGYVPSATIIYGVIWEDIDRDGASAPPENGEPTLSGVTVRLYDSLNNLVATTTTAADGTYEFVGAYNGTYRVSVDPMTGPLDGAWIQTYDSNGLSTLNSVQLTVVTGGSGTADFSYAQSGVLSIGDTLFYDWNGNGIQDAGEEGVAQVTVRLYRDAAGDGVYQAVDDALIRTDVTDSAGNYLFTLLPPGDYLVVVDRSDPDMPPIYDVSADPDGGFDAMSGVTLVGSSKLDQDFGFDPEGFGAISGVVWRDVNADTVRLGSAESGIANITVTLYADFNGDGVYEAIESTTTNSLGAYSFSNLPDGPYRVDVSANDPDLPEDAFGNPWYPTTSTAQSVSLSGGTPSSSPEFGFASPAAIGDLIFFDVNGNGQLDTNEPGIANVVVDLYLNGGYVRSVTTDADGLYQFNNLAPGNYEVRVNTSTGALAVAGLVLSSDPDSDGEPCTGPLANGCDGIKAQTLSAGQIYSGADFGYVLPGATVSGTLWIDFDNDGVVDVSEVGLPFITLTLYNDLGAMVATTETDENGEYSFGGLVDDIYRIEVDGLDADFPAGIGQTYEFDGSLNGILNDIVVAAGSVSSVAGSPSDGSGLDFGYRYNGNNTLSGTIGLETGVIDGVMGSGDTGVNGDEVPFEGITVYIYLWNDDGDNVVEPGEAELLGSTLTNGSGDYSFVDLPEGDGDDLYLVSMTPTLNALSLTTELGDTPATVLVESLNSQQHTTGAYQGVPVDQSVTGMDFAFESLVAYDFGDLPESYSVLLPGGARHVLSLIPNLFLGASVDSEGNGVVSADSSAEGADDDGVVVTGIWSNGAGGGSLEIVVSGTGYLVGYIDWNRDGDFLDADEMVLSEAVTTGTLARTIDLPADALLESGTTEFYARFRLLPTAPFIPELAFTGEAANGEVEDYLYAFYTLSGTVYVDNDSGGTINVGDSGQTGVVVELYKDAVLVASAVTDFNGAYSFQGLPPDDYEIRMTTPAGATAVFDVDGPANGNDSIDRSLTASLIEQDFLISAGVTQRSITGTVFVDTNGDGLFGGDTPIEGVQVNLYRDLDNDGTPDPTELIGSINTDPSGDYTFLVLALGDNYLVEMVDSAGVEVIRDLDNAADANSVLGLIEVDVTSGNAVDQDFLTDYNASIAGTVRIDNTGDTLGDLPHAGVSVDLLDASDNVLASTVTLADGSYLFEGLAPGTYKVRQTLPTGYFAVADVDGGLLTVIGDVALVTVGPSAEVTGQDFVNRLNGASVGDVVWMDVDGDGLQDPGEPGLNGVTVRLLDSLGAVVESVVTANNGGGQPGYYAFSGLEPGDYRVEFVLPGSYAFTTQNADSQGVAGAANSDADTTTGRSDLFTLDYGDSVTHVDAGLLSADLALSKAVLPPAVNVGDTVTYTLTLTNLGPTLTTGITVEDLFPFGISYVSHIASQGTFDFGTSVWTVGSLAVGESVTLTMEATISSGHPGDAYANFAQVASSDVPDPDLSNNTAQAVVLISGLSITKTSDVVGSAAIGDTITYTIVVENIGVGTHANVVVEDVLPEGVTYAGNLNVVLTNASPLPTGSYTNTVAGASTFVVPAGVNALTVQAWGAGGSGTSSGVASGGGGGGGGGYARSVFASVSPGTSYNLYVGAGGGAPSAGNVGLPGETTWFGSITTLRAAGGFGGAAVTAGGAGGSNNLGGVTFAGGAGGAGANTGGSRAGGGGGGSAFFNAVGGVGGAASGATPGTGGLGTGNGGVGGTPSGAGAVSGVAPGGGGGGSAGNSLAAAGANGRILITYEVSGTVGTSGPPPTLVTGYTLGEGATLTITYDVTVNDPAPSATLLNTASVRSDLSPIAIEDSVEDPVLVGSISGTVRIDTNDDSLGDTPQAGVALALLDAFGNPVLDSEGAPKTAVTDVNGSYSFTLLTPGTEVYQVQQTVPSGFVAISDVDGVDFTRIGDQIRISVVGGVDTANQDFVNTQYGVLETPNFCLDMGVALDGIFIRPTGLPGNVVYKLQYADVLGNPTIWDGTVTLGGGNTTTVDNLDGTETVTIGGVPTLTGLTSGSGFVRLVVEVDANNDSTPDETFLSAVSGWVETTFGTSCTTYNDPFLSCPPYSGTVQSVAGQAMVFADTLPAIGAGFYVEVTDGAFEGHRFDIDTADANSITVPEDAELTSLASPFNTLAGTLPDLSGATIVVRKHRTLDDLLPVNELTANINQALADQVTLWNGTQFVCYYLYFASPNRWVEVGDNTLTDAGGTLVPPGHGMFVLSRAPKTITAHGQVRANNFVRPLAAGNNLVGGGYPLDQSPDGRGMTPANGFTANADYTLADQFLVWRGDDNAGQVSYNTYYRINWGALQQWTRMPDYSFIDQSAATLFLRHRASLYQMKSPVLGHTYSQPWTP